MLPDIEKLKDVTIPSGKLYEAIEKTRDTIHTMWEDSPSKDSEGREDCYRQLKGLDMVMLRLIRDME